MDNGAVSHSINPGVFLPTAAEKMKKSRHSSDRILMGEGSVKSGKVFTYSLSAALFLAGALAYQRQTILAYPGRRIGRHAK